MSYDIALYDLCDKVLRDLSTSKNLSNQVIEKMFGFEQFILITQTLGNDKYIQVFGLNVAITPLGEKFINDGGYRGKHERETQQQGFIDALNKSVLDTNLSVRDTNNATRNNFTIQKRLTWASILVAGSSAVIALGTAYFSSKGVTSEEVKETNKQLQRQVQVLDSMLQVQKAIGSFRGKAASDSLSKK